MMRKHISEGMPPSWQDSKRLIGRVTPCAPPLAAMARARGLILLVACLACGLSSVRGAERASPHYAMAHEAIDSGGQRVMSAHYLIYGEAGGIGGRSQSPSGSTPLQLRAGFPAQITDAPDAITAGDDSITRPNTTRVAKVRKTTLLANDSDADLDPLTLTGVGNPTPAGATVVMIGAFVVYTAPSTTAGDGSFTYTLSDGPGGHSATATVSVIQTSVQPVGPGANAANITLDGQNFIITFIGVPGHAYRVQNTTSAGPLYIWGEFSPPAIYTAPANGVFRHTDINPPAPLRLYRAIPNP